MQLSRRGFLSVLASAAATAATFDPKSMLWVPAPKSILPVELTVPTLDQVGQALEITKLAETQLELNELALKVAKQMTERLMRSESVALREVMFRHSGHVRVGLLEVDEIGVGAFEPAYGRFMVTLPPRDRAKYLDSTSLARALAYDLGSRASAYDMFAPISAELRPGEPFTDDVAIGWATDPDSGLSVRVMRFEQDRVGTMLSAEMAGGCWVGKRELARRAALERERSWQYQYEEDEEEV